MINRFATVVAGACFMHGTPATAGAPTPFATSDRNPLVAIHGLPDQGRWFFEPSEQPQTSVALDLGNTLHNENGGDETLLIDAETQWLTFGIRTVIDGNWLLQAQLPRVRHSGGNLDDFIGDFHDVFGFPDGGRPGFPEDQIAIRYSRDGQQALDINSARSGWGDLRVSAAYQPDRGTDHGSAWWMQLKLDNGDSDELVGSGAPSLALWGAGWRRDAALHTYLGGGVLLLPEGDVLREEQRDWTWFARGGGAYNLSCCLALQIELETHGALYDTGTRALGQSVQVHIGGWLAPTPDSRMQLIVSEDVRVRSAPDVVFHVSWHQRL